MWMILRSTIMITKKQTHLEALIDLNQELLSIRWKTTMGDKANTDRGTSITPMGNRNRGIIDKRRCGRTFWVDKNDAYRQGCLGVFILGWSAASSHWCVICNV